MYFNKCFNTEQRGAVPGDNGECQAARVQVSVHVRGALSRGNTRMHERQEQENFPRRQGWLKYSVLKCFNLMILKMKCLVNLFLYFFGEFVACYFIKVNFY